MRALQSGALTRYLFKPLLFLACLVPVGLLALGVWQQDLGANPVETVEHTTGDWTLRLLLLTLAITPLRRFTGQTALLRFRRMLGLYAFFYGVLHFLTWLWLDQGLRWEEILADVVKRPYITVGFTALLLMLPLAATSTRGMMRRLGRRWKTLHRLVYLVAGLGVLHYLWLVKADWLEPALYGVVLALLLLARLPAWRWHLPGRARSLSDCRGS